MKPPATSRVIKPQQCVFAFGIPTSEEAFLASRVAVGDYYAMRYEDWDHYKIAFGRNAMRIQTKAEKLGVNVKSDISYQEFAQLFNGEFDVIILFSHWDGDAIEFRGGFATAAQIVDRITNPKFAEFVDLAICQSWEFGDSLKKSFPNCAVFVGDRNLSPNLWLAYYSALFKRLKNHNFLYLDAVTENLKCFGRRPWISRVRSAVAKNLNSTNRLDPRPLGPARE